MRIIVFSDSHGNTRCMDRAIAAIGSFDAIIHLGDIDRDVRYLEQNYSQYPIYAVQGNNDFYCQREKELTAELGGVKIYMCHGHTRDVRRGTEGMLTAAQSRGCTAALYGHTHIPHDETVDGVLIFNPGSCAMPRNGKPSFGILEIENGKCSSVVVDWII
ncbi:MAG: metallophosphoesterase family protein [Clostridia bacterium]